MRCLTLADRLRSLGAAVQFLCRSLPQYLQELIEEHGHVCVRLAHVEAGGEPYVNVYAAWLGCSQRQDAQATRAAMAGRVWDWLVVDHYALDVEWESGVRTAARRLLVIDDLAERAHDCDLLLDQNYYAELADRYSGKVSAKTQLLLGPRYVLLRQEFLERKIAARVRRGRVCNVLVFFGGMDCDNVTSLAIEALVTVTSHHVANVAVVIGAQHPHQVSIQARCKEFGYACHVQTSNMAELIAAADIAVGAGGAATWERCALGLPSIVLVLADNQRQAMADLAQAGIVVNVGDATHCTLSGLASHISSLMGDEARRTSMSSKSIELMSADGNENVAEIMLRKHAEI